MNRLSDVGKRNLHSSHGLEHFETVIIGGGQAGLSVGTTWRSETGRS